MKVFICTLLTISLIMIPENGNTAYPESFGQQKNLSSDELEYSLEEWSQVFDSFFEASHIYSDRIFTIPDQEQSAIPQEAVYELGDTEHIAELFTTKDDADIPGSYRPGHFVEDFVVSTGTCAMPVYSVSHPYVQGLEHFKDIYYDADMIFDVQDNQNINLRGLNYKDQIVQYSRTINPSQCLSEENCRRLEQLGFNPYRTKTLSLSMPYILSRGGILFYDGEKEAYMPLDSFISDGVRETENFSGQRFSPDELYETIDGPIGRGVYPMQEIIELTEEYLLEKGVSSWSELGWVWP